MGCIGKSSENASREAMRAILMPVTSAILLVLRPKNLKVAENGREEPGAHKTALAPAGPGFPRLAPSVKTRQVEVRAEAIRRLVSSRARRD